MNVVRLTPLDFVKFLVDRGIRRFHFVYDQGGMVSSHPSLQPMADFIAGDKRDFMIHEGLFFQLSSEHDILQGAFVHRTCRGQAAGGVRYWHYDTMEDYLRDGLRLAKGMTRKNALAGLWWGGGKGVMAERPDVDKFDAEVRASVYRDYGRLMTSIRGCYVTAEDVGTHVTDMANIFAASRFTTCIPPTLGGSGNPSVPTARGVICGMEAALEFEGLGSLEGKTVAVQGMGNVGEPLIGLLFEKKVAAVMAGDIYPEVVERVKRTFSDRNLETSVLEEGDESLFEATCNIFSPNATGAVLNDRTIPKIKARIVCGAANNQLEDSVRDDALLHEKGIVYVPDFLTNRMGIVNCANEQYGYVNDDPLFEQHLSRDWEHSIHQTALDVLGAARDAGEPTAKIALKRADELSLVNHPVFGHRGRQIIASLVQDRWYEGDPWKT